MSQPQSHPSLEKASEFIKFRVTPTELSNYRAASRGNLSGWLKQAANERLPMPPRQHSLNPRRAL